MPIQFNAEEVESVIRMARLQAPAFSKEEYQRLLRMQQDIKESGFIEAAWGLRRLEEEYGADCSESLDRYRQLLRDKEGLEGEIEKLNDKREVSSQELRVLDEAISQSEQKRIELENELETTYHRVNREKRRLGKDLEESRKAAEISQEEIASAKELKAIVKKSGLELGLALELCGEFARSNRPAKKIAQTVKEYGSLLEAGKKLKKQNEDLAKEIEEKLKESESLLSRCDRTRQELWQLGSELDNEKAVHNFYKRYKDSSSLLDYLADWGFIYPTRCQMITCNARFLVSRDPSHFRTKYVCPSCGLTTNTYDNEASTKLGLPYGSPFNVKLGGIRHG